MFYFKPILHPGVATFSYETSFLRPVSGRLPTTFNIIRTVAGLSLPVRCTIGFGFYFGSCSYPDLCQDFMQDVLGFLLDHGIDFNCPFDIPVKSVETSFDHEIPDLSTSIVPFLASGDFDVTITVNNSSNQHIACMRLKYTIQKQ